MAIGFFPTASLYNLTVTGGFKHVFTRSLQDYHAQQDAESNIAAYSSLIDLPLFAGVTYVLIRSRFTSGLALTAVVLGSAIKAATIASDCDMFINNGQPYLKPSALIERLRKTTETTEQTFTVFFSQPESLEPSLIEETIATELRERMLVKIQNAVAACNCWGSASRTLRRASELFSVLALASAWSGSAQRVPSFGAALLLTKVASMYLAPPKLKINLQHLFKTVLREFYDDLIKMAPKTTVEDNYQGVFMQALQNPERIKWVAEVYECAKIAVAHELTLIGAHGLDLGELSRI